MYVSSICDVPDETSSTKKNRFCNQLTKKKTESSHIYVTFLAKPALQKKSFFKPSRQTKLNQLYKKNHETSSAKKIVVQKNRFCSKKSSWRNQLYKKKIFLLYEYRK